MLATALAARDSARYNTAHLPHEAAFSATTDRGVPWSPKRLKDGTRASPSLCSDRGWGPGGRIHVASSVPSNRLYAPTAPLLGPRRPGPALRPEHRRQAGGPEDVLLPRPRGAPRREVAARRRHVAATGPPGVVLPEPQGRLG